MHNSVYLRLQGDVCILITGNAHSPTSAPPFSRMIGIRWKNVPAPKIHPDIESKLQSHVPTHAAHVSFARGMKRGRSKHLQGGMWVHSHSPDDVEGAGAQGLPQGEGTPL